MNREIKFRSWNPILKRMTFSDELLRIGFQYSDNSKSFQVLNLVSGNDVNKILMQFTGRVDINNNEIWEGDICKNQWNRIVVVRWINDLYWDEEGSSHPGFWFTHNKHINDNEFDLDYHDSFDKLQVIGNIYENPELLEND